MLAQGLEYQKASQAQLCDVGAENVGDDDLELYFKIIVLIVAFWLGHFMST